MTCRHAKDADGTHGNRPHDATGSLSPAFAVAVAAALAALLVLPCPAWAQGAAPTASLQGCVSEESGTLPGVAIVVAGDVTRRQATTDAAGCYAITGLPPGTYRLTATIIPWLPETRERIALQAGESRRLDLVMTLAPGAIREPPLQIIPGTGGITACAADTGGGVLPGVTFAVKSGATARSAATRTPGCASITGLPPDTYTLTATLAGFITQTLDDIVVREGRATDVAVTLPIAPITDVLWVDVPQTLAEAVRKADAVVYLRIERLVGEKRWTAFGKDVIEKREMAGLEFEATVLWVAKADTLRLRSGQAGVGPYAYQRRAPAKADTLRLRSGQAPDRPLDSSITFLQVARPTTEPRYREGEVFVAFLTWDANAGSYQRLAGPLWHVPVRDGRIAPGNRTWLASYNGTDVADFLAEIERLK